jgi:hypothetical protein
MIYVSSKRRMICRVTGVHTEKKVVWRIRLLCDGSNRGNIQVFVAGRATASPKASSSRTSTTSHVTRFSAKAGNNIDQQTAMMIEKRMGYFWFIIEIIIYSYFNFVKKLKYEYIIQTKNNY